MNASPCLFLESGLTPLCRALNLFQSTDSLSMFLTRRAMGQTVTLSPSTLQREVRTHKNKTNRCSSHTWRVKDTLKVVEKWIHDTVTQTRRKGDLTKAHISITFKYPATQQCVMLIVTSLGCLCFTVQNNKHTELDTRGLFWLFSNLPVEVGKVSLCSL